MRVKRPAQPTDQPLVVVVAPLPRIFTPGTRALVQDDIIGSGCGRLGKVPAVAAEVLLLYGLMAACALEESSLESKAVRDGRPG